MGLDIQTEIIDLEPQPSPMESEMTNSSPNTEYSEPCSSPQQKNTQLLKDTRAAARKKLGELSLEEKVRPKVSGSAAAGARS
jgi:beta-glucosidase